MKVTGSLTRKKEYLTYIPEANYKGTKKITINGEDGRRYFKIIPYLGVKSSAAYRIKVSGEVLEYMIHPETKKIISKEEFEKETQNNQSETTDEQEENFIQNTDVKQFDDISTSNWYHDDILEARRFGLIEGVDNNNYAPKDTITVAQAITMAVRFHQKKTNTDFLFNRYDCCSACCGG